MIYRSLHRQQSALNVDLVARAKNAELASNPDSRMHYSYLVVFPRCSRSNRPIGLPFDRILLVRKLAKPQGYYYFNQMQNLYAMNRNLGNFH